MNLFYSNHQSIVQKLLVAKQYSEQRKKIQHLMRNEAPYFVTGIQKSILADDRPLRVQSGKHVGKWGDRISRLDTLRTLLSKQSVSEKNCYNYGWSSLSASEDGHSVVVLDHLGQTKWYKIRENHSTSHNVPIPVAKWKFESAGNSKINEKDNQHCFETDKHVPEGVEIINGVGSSDTFQMLLLKSRKQVQINKIFFQSDQNYRSQQNVGSDKLNTKLLDACVLSSGVPGIYDSYVIADENGDISLQNLYKRTIPSSKTIVGSLRDENLLFQSTPVWAVLKASASGKYIYGATRKMIQMFDLRSRPRHHGSAIQLFSIARDRNTAKESILTEADGSLEMIGGIANDSQGSDRALCFSTNARIVTVDKRMPCRAYTQMRLHCSPSFSKKVSLPSGLASLSVSSTNDGNFSKLNYLASWWSYPSTNQHMYPTAIIGCFDQSYAYCPCNVRPQQALPVTLEDSCDDGDHTNINQAPIVVRGLPLHVGSPLNHIDFSNKPTVNRLSLPWTGLTMTTTLSKGTKIEGNSLLILGANSVGDIFLTDISRNSNQDLGDLETQNFHSYYWESSENCTSLQNQSECDEKEMMKEKWITDWWAWENCVTDECQLERNIENPLVFGKFKTAQMIHNLKPYSQITSDTDVSRIGISKKTLENKMNCDKKTNASEKDKAGKICAILTDGEKVICDTVNVYEKETSNRSIEIASEDKPPCENDITSHKAVKDPNRPKRFISSYIFFKNSVMKSVRKDNPTWKMLEVMKEINRRWYGLSEAQKEKYKDMSAKDKVRYDEEMKTYQAPPEVIKDELKTNKDKIGRVCAMRNPSHYPKVQEIRDKVRQNARERKAMYRAKNRRLKEKKVREWPYQTSYAWKDDKDLITSRRYRNSIKNKDKRACPKLKLIIPENYTGAQGLKSSDQLSENKLSSELHIRRTSYINNVL